MKIALAVILVFFSFLQDSCTERKWAYKNHGDSQYEEANHTEQNQLRLMSSHPLPALDYSLELENLSERLNRFNDPNKTSYIYLMSDMGQIYAFFPIKGKVSSVNSLLSTGDQIVDDPFGPEGVTVESPQLDGSYGTNGDAIFFFTAENVYVEWNGKYILMDQPLQLTEQPLLIYDATE